MLRALRKKSKPILWFIIIFISFVFIVWGVGSGGRKDQANYVAEVNGKKISLDAFQNLYEKYHKDYSQFYLDKEELNREAKKFALEEFIRYHLLLEEAKREKIGVSKKEITQSVRTLFVDEKGIFNQKGFDAALKQRPASWWRELEEDVQKQIKIKKLVRLIKDSTKVSPSQIEEYFKKEYLTAKVRHIFIDPKNKVKEEEIVAYYQEHQDEFVIEEEVQASHILLNVPDPKKEEEVEKKIQELLARIKNGEDFAALAKEYSTCPSSKKGGDLGFFKKGQMVKEFESAAFSLKVGEVSEPVKTQFGWHIIKLADRRPAKIKPLEEVQEEVVSKLVNEDCWTLAREEADSISLKLKEGASFEELAREFSDGKTAKDGGSLGIIPKSMTLPGFDQKRLEEFEGEVTRFGSFIDPEFSQAAFSLKEGETGEPVKSNLGYHIIRVQEKILPPLDKLDEIREEVSARLLREEENRLFSRFYKSLKKKAKIKIDKNLGIKLEEETG